MILAEESHIEGRSIPSDNLIPIDPLVKDVSLNQLAELIAYFHEFLETAEFDGDVIKSLRESLDVYCKTIPCEEQTLESENKTLPLGEKFFCDLWENRASQKSVSLDTSSSVQVNKSFATENDIGSVPRHSTSDSLEKGLLPQGDNLEKSNDFLLNPPERKTSPDELYFSEFEKISYDFYGNPEIQKIVLSSQEFVFKTITCFSKFDDGTVFFFCFKKKRKKGCSNFSFNS